MEDIIGTEIEINEILNAMTQSIFRTVKMFSQVQTFMKENGTSTTPGQRATATQMIRNLNNINGNNNTHDMQSMAVIERAQIKSEHDQSKTV